MGGGKDLELQAGFGGRDLELQAVPGFGFLPQKLVAVTDLLFQVKLEMLFQVKLLGSDFPHS